MVNCNLQRLDGPVRGNKRIIDELEGIFRGAGWYVIKVIWGGDWDELFERDSSGLLLKRMEECVDGDYQAFKAKGGAYLRQEFFGKYPELLELVSDKTDEQLENLHRGGHDPAKIYNAYRKAINHHGSPTVILAKTVKGYGLGSNQARNASHQEKKLTDSGLAQFVKRFKIPVPEQQAKLGKPYGRRRIARRLSTFRNAAVPWAVTCPIARCPSWTSRLPSLALSASGRRAPRGGQFRPLWVSSASCAIF